MSATGHLMISTTEDRPSPAPRTRPAKTVAARRVQDWPAEVDMILSALDAGGYTSAQERRALPRLRHRVHGWLRLFTDGPGDPARVLYTRDINRRGLGFITAHRLPLGYGGLVELPKADGTGATVTVHCTLLRCREAAPGWYEGSVYFNREQPALVPDGPERRRRPHVAPAV